jgi:hypothetical protein
LQRVFLPIIQTIIILDEAAAKAVQSRERSVASRTADAILPSKGREGRGSGGENRRDCQAYKQA